MMHFTMTGPLAGRPYCGQQKNPEEVYTHLPYNQEAITTCLTRPDFCPACKAVWERGLLQDVVEDHLRAADPAFTEAEIDRLLERSDFDLRILEHLSYTSIREWLTQNPPQTN